MKLETLHKEVRELRKENKDDHEEILSQLIGVKERTSNLEGKYSVLFWVVGFIGSGVIALVALMLT